LSPGNRASSKSNDVWANCILFANRYFHIAIKGDSIYRLPLDKIIIQRWRQSVINPNQSRESAPFEAKPPRRDAASKERGRSYCVGIIALPPEIVS
jgi:hypothetical protein